jgi:hypothetical protein
MYYYWSIVNIHSFKMSTSFSIISHPQSECVQFFELTLALSFAKRASKSSSGARGAVALLAPCVVGAGGNGTFSLDFMVCNGMLPSPSRLSSGAEVGGDPPSALSRLPIWSVMKRRNALETDCSDRVMSI